MHGHLAATDGTMRPQYEYRTYRARHDPTGPARASTTVVHAVADATGADVSRCDAAVRDSVDVEALDRLFDASGGPVPGGQFGFYVWNRHVTVFAEGTVVVRTPAR